MATLCTLPILLCCLTFLNFYVTCRIHADVIDLCSFFRDLNPWSMTQLHGGYFKSLPIQEIDKIMNFFKNKSSSILEIDKIMNFFKNKSSSILEIDKIMNFFKNKGIGMKLQKISLFYHTKLCAIKGNPPTQETKCLTMIGETQFGNHDIPQKSIIANQTKKNEFGSSSHHKTRNIKLESTTTFKTVTR